MGHDITFHEVPPPETPIAMLACDLCGCLVDRSEQGRRAHQDSHNKTFEVIDLTIRHERELQDHPA